MPEKSHALVVVGHPDPQSFNHALAHAAKDALEATGHTVELRDLHAERFDPVIPLWEVRGKRARDPLVLAHIAALKRARVLVVVHPNYWGAPPAVVKGWIDRVFAPDSAYAFEKGADQGDAPAGLLDLDAAVVLNTTNTLREREAAAFGDPLERIWRDCVLRYCGVRDVQRAVFGVVATSTPALRRSWLEQAHTLVRRVAKNRP